MNIGQWWVKHDPGGMATRRGIKAAVVVGGNFAIASQLFKDSQMATFAAFGSFALLLFANFPGGWRARLWDYVGLGVVSVVLISLGTLAARPDWLATVAMLVVGFGVLFAGVVSSVINGGAQAALLTFLLAILLPSGIESLPHRLAGWGLALLVAVPVSLFVWPPNDANRLRELCAQACRSLSDLLALRRPGPGDPVVAVATAMTAVRQQFGVAAVRFTSLSSANRLVIRLVDELEWLATTVLSACADAPEGWPPEGRRLRTASADVLEAAADILHPQRHNLPGQDLKAKAAERISVADMKALIARLTDARVAVAAETLAALRASAEQEGDAQAAGEFERPLYAAHELGYTVALAGHTAATVAKADARSWWSRVLGRDRPFDDDAAPVIASRVARDHLTWRSAWLRNSIRGAAGLAVAVLVARLFDAQNAFWIGLGALSILRSTALSTGTVAVRALVGTVIGFALGGAIVAVIGTSPAVLWPLLPVVIFLAAFAPASISFIAGQAAFTVFSIVLFNLIAPIGWKVGIVRLEDVALGCGSGLVAGVLFWPRGSGPALGQALSDAYRSGAEFLHRAVTGLLGTERVAAIELPDPGASHRLDDAFRQYLAETGTKLVPLGSVVALTNGAARLRLAGHAVIGLGRAPDPAGLADPAGVLHSEVDAIREWFNQLSGLFVGDQQPVPVIEPASTSFLDVVLPAVDKCGDADRAAGAERLLWAGQYVGDVDRVRAELVGAGGSGARCAGQAVVAAVTLVDHWKI